jgi:hypothetical protein
VSRLKAAPPAVQDTFTTSYVDLQPINEIKEDQHPIIVIAAADIVGLLRMHGVC